MNDAHEDLGRMIWGDKAYDSDPQTYRQRAKIARHALVINPDFVTDALEKIREFD